MFSTQAQQIELLRRYLPGPAVDLLREILANAKQPITHYGTIEAAGPTPLNADGDPVPKKAAIHLPDRREMMAKGNVHGAMKWAKAMEDQRTVSNARTGQDEYWVRCRKTANNAGESPTGGWYDVLLHPTSGTPDVKKDDILLHFYDENRTPVAFPSTTAAGTLSVDVVTDVYCGDDGLIHVCTRTIALPAGSAVGAEHCG